MPRSLYRSQAVLVSILAGVICLMLTSCQSSQAHGGPSIEFSRIPPAGDGTPDQLEEIEGRVMGALPGNRVVLFALSGVWWVQPTAAHAFTAIQPDSKWKTSTHPGSAYAALLVDASYHPPLTVNALPEKGGPVLAVTIVKGATPSSPPITLEFSGYQWNVSQVASNQGGSGNFYTPSNTWIDRNGFLHLRVSGQEDHWESAEVTLARSLGYGSYRFVVSDISHLEPAAVLAFLTWDELGPPREMDIEISRWGGEPQDKNAQYVVQPYVVPANTVRFAAPAGTLTHWMDWEPGRVSFKTVRGRSNNHSDVIGEHVFTSGVPSAGNERIHINLYVYGNKRHPLQHEFEVIIEKFEFLP